jgi:hypothetical protein
MPIKSQQANRSDSAEQEVLDIWECAICGWTDAFLGILTVTAIHQLCNYYVLPHTVLSFYYCSFHQHVAFILGNISYYVTWVRESSSSGD